MRFGAGVVERVIRGYGIACLGSILLVLLSVPSIAWANTTSVQTTVNSGTIHPSLALTGVTSPLTVNKMPFKVSGTVDSITQIQVYVDNVLSVTIPLNAGATSFENDLIIPLGSHTIKFVGISPFADISPTETISINYILPPAGSETVDTAVGSSSETKPSDKWGGATISRGETTSTSTVYMPNEHKSVLPPWLYSGLLTVDIARPGDSDKQILEMAQRLALIVIGSLLFIFARQVLYAYQQVRFSWFSARSCKLPRRTHRSPTFRFRTFGFLLIISVFLLS